MTSQPSQPRPDGADDDAETTPTVVAGELRQIADELGAVRDGPDRPIPKRPEHSIPDRDSPGATIDDPEPAEPNEPG